MERQEKYELRHLYYYIIDQNKPKNLNCKCAQRVLNGPLKLRGGILLYGLLILTLCKMYIRLLNTEIIYF